MSNYRSGSVILVAQDLFFLGRIDSLASPLGFHVSRASNENDFLEQLSATHPDLILLDLESDESLWISALEHIKQINPGSLVISYGPHEALDKFKKAEDLGSSITLSKGQFSRDLPKILSDLKSQIPD